MPMILEAVIAILACSRIGAVHSVIVRMPTYLLYMSQGYFRMFKIGT